ncbi:MAG: GMC family oxidoreductase N-terminal domain-containing protein [Thermomicrobium sp.]|nr:GMC family oxidoreductase N-terminal domain-containing protein [Thermomicrobium sp.]MDW7982943.1 GMC family oxidoreductase N-terminal domain-containing protein [Thermomicrobium sp.]
MTRHETDIVVIGGGTAGVVVAVRLAQRTELHVTLLEAGPSDEGNPLVLDYRRWMELLDSALVRNYEIAPQPFGNSAIRQSRAYVLGGCSSHNSVIAFVPLDADFDHWVRLGADGWSPHDVRPYYDRVLDTVPLMLPPSGSPYSQAFIAAAERAGYPTTDFRQWNGRDAAGWLWFNAKDTTRMSSSVAYLHARAVPLPNLTIEFETVAHALILNDHGECLGVRTSRGEYYASHEVVLACGAIGSPKLLLLSGIGPADHLRALGIPVRHELPGVGQNLVDHIEGVVIWETKTPVAHGDTQFWEAAVFARCDATSPWPEIMIHFGILPFDMHTRAAGFPTPEHGCSMTPNVTHPRSRGTLRLRSADPEVPPIIDPQYFTDPDGYDLQVMIEGIRVARAIAASEPLHSLLAAEVAPGSRGTTEEELRRYIAQTCNTVYHPAGTCRMGSPSDETAVVDPRLRVNGIERLRIADASIFPDMITVNPCITCMMIGERCADFILEDL